MSMDRSGRNVEGGNVGEERMVSGLTVKKLLFAKRGLWLVEGRLTNNKKVRAPRKFAFHFLIFVQISHPPPQFTILLL